MSPEDHRILREFAAGVRQIEPEARIWAFGSRARGDADPDSDMDLCVVVPDLTPELRQGVGAVAWQVGFGNDRVFTTVILSGKEFEDGPISASTLVKNIRAEGVAV